MDKKTVSDVLQLLDCPAFSVENGTIIAANAQARQKMISVGASIRDLIQCSAEDYDTFLTGELHTTVTVGDASYGASVSVIDGFQIFRLESENASPKLQAMSLVAEMLRNSLSEIMPAADRLLQEDLSQLNQDVCQVNRGLYEILRMANHMSQTVMSPYSFLPDEILDLDAFFEETVTKAAHLLESSEYHIEYAGTAKPVYGRANARILEQAAYGLISNAVKFSPAGGSISVKLSQKGDRAYFTVEDSGCGIAPEVCGKVFTRYEREAGIEDGRYGLGLGMVLVQRAAAAHNGTVLMGQTESGGTRVTLVLDLQSHSDKPLRCHTTVVDTTGGWDPALVCLSDVLPGSVYGK